MTRPNPFGIVGQLKASATLRDGILKARFEPEAKSGPLLIALMFVGSSRKSLL